MPNYDDEELLCPFLIEEMRKASLEREKYGTKRERMSAIRRRLNDLCQQTPDVWDKVHKEFEAARKLAAERTGDSRAIELADEKLQILKEVITEAEYARRPVVARRDQVKDQLADAQRKVFFANKKVTDLQRLQNPPKST